MVAPGDPIIPLQSGHTDQKDEAKPAELHDPERLARTVFVGNVPAITKRKELKRLFKPYGSVEAVRLRGVVGANPKLPKKTALLARRMHKDCDTVLAYVVFKQGTSVVASPEEERKEKNPRAKSKRESQDRSDGVADGGSDEDSDEQHDAGTDENMGNNLEGDGPKGIENGVDKRVPIGGNPSSETPTAPAVYDKPTASVRAACAALNLTILHEKHLRVNPALHTRGPLRQSIFLGNLPFDVTEEELIVLFKEVAKEAGCNLVGVRVTRDKETGMGRGVGFVSFDDDLGVRAAMNRSGMLELRGRALRMERAAKEKKRNSKTFKRLAKANAQREKKLKSGKSRANGSTAKRKRDERTGELLTRKIKKQRSDKRAGKKVKHAARKARQAEAAAASAAVGTGQ